MSPRSRVLSIDLDVFVEPPVMFVGDDNPRPCDADHRVASVHEVTGFLLRCGLDQTSPVRGIVMEYHVELFHQLRSMMDSGLLHRPFDLVHADAHADMAAGISMAPRRIMTEVLFEAPERRVPLAAEFVTSADWLAWAVACRWVKSIVHVRHSAELAATRDYVDCWFRDDNPSSGIVEMKAYEPSRFPDLYCGTGPAHVEPPTAFRTCELNTYRTSCSFDLVSICRSPAFVPPNADALLPILASFVRIG
jgi:hypothetical protein